MKSRWLCLVDEWRRVCKHRLIVYSNTKVLRPPDSTHRQVEQHHHIVVGRSLNQILCFVEWMESTHSPIRCCCLTGYAPTLLNHHESRLSSEFLHWVALRAFLFTLKPQPPPPRAVVYLSLLCILHKPSVTSPIHRLQWQWGTVCDCDPHNTKPSLSSSLSDKNKMFTTINEMWNGRMGRRQTAIRTPMRRSNPITSSVHQSIVHRELQRVFFVVLNEWVIHDYVLGYCLTLSLFRCLWCSALFSKPNVPHKYLLLIHPLFLIIYLR